MLEKIKDIRKTEEKAEKLIEQAKYSSAILQDEVINKKTKLEQRYEDDFNSHKKIIFADAVKSAEKEISGNTALAAVKVKEVESEIAKNLKKAIALIRARLTEKI